MLTLEHALERLRRATFKVRIEENDSGAWEWGTGFFISSDGYALTAFHNLPAAVIAAGRGRVSAYYRGAWIELECLVGDSLLEEDGDIALLRWTDADRHPPEHLPVAYVPLEESRQERTRLWAGRPVCALGFPIEQPGQGERFVEGTIDAAQPYVEVDRKSLQGVGPAIAGSTEWLRFYSDRARKLKGISGAPILDRETGCVVAVEHRYYPELKIVYATEIGRMVGLGNGRTDLLDRLPDARDLSRVERDPTRDRPYAGPPLSDRKAERRYREQLIAEIECLRVPGVGKELDLEQIYIPLRVGRYVSPDRLPDEASRRTSAADPPLGSAAIDAVEAITRTPHRLVVLGEPGSGKTTLLRYIALRIARRDRAFGAWAREIIPSPWARAADRLHRLLTGAGEHTTLIGLAAGILGLIVWAVGIFLSSSKLWAGAAWIVLPLPLLVVLVRYSRRAVAVSSLVILLVLAGAARAALVPWYAIAATGAALVVMLYPYLIATPAARLQRLRDRWTRYPLPLYVTLNDVVRRGEPLDRPLGRALAAASPSGCGHRSGGQATGIGRGRTLACPFPFQVSCASRRELTPIAFSSMCPCRDAHDVPRTSVPLISLTCWRFRPRHANCGTSGDTSHQSSRCDEWFLSEWNDVEWTPSPLSRRPGQKPRERLRQLSDGARCCLVDG